MKTIITTQGETVTLEKAAEGAIFFAGSTVGLAGSVVLLPKDLAEIGFELVTMAAEHPEGTLHVETNAIVYGQRIKAALDAKGDAFTASGPTLRIEEAELVDMTEVDRAAEFDSEVDLRAIADAIEAIEPITKADGTEIVFVPMSVDVRDLVVRVLEGDAAMNDAMHEDGEQDENNDSPEGDTSSAGGIGVTILPADVIALVKAARRIAFGDQDPEAIKLLDAASEAFADRVQWEDEPTNGAEGGSETPPPPASTDASSAPASEDPAKPVGRKKKAAAEA